ncbi:MAG: 3-deoxy-7-phosphoheptulonate synthase [Planctomycetes bacterium]|nr:3-deoxy-7-phosphoheptulonate synthase [Planctomycetota bacterium]
MGGTASTLRALGSPAPAARTRRVVQVGAVAFGAPRPVVIAGPCAVETREQTCSLAREVLAAGADMLRGGAFKPRTSPYDFQGLGEEGLRILQEAREETGLPVVTEVLDVRQVDLVSRYADMLQIGSRSMQNFPLLREVGRQPLPVLLKRGMAATLHEWLCAAEYVASGGNTRIVLCERGVRTGWTAEYDRNTLDLNVVEAVRRAVDLPIIVDPSHGTGRAHLVPSASLAGIAAGADGLIIEVIGLKTRRADVLCDAEQGIRPDMLARVVRAVGQVRAAREEIEAARASGAEDA